MISKKLASWMFNSLYWFDMKLIPKKKWKEILMKRYVETGMSKNFKKGTFKATWLFIKKEGLIRDGNAKTVKIRVRLKNKKNKKLKKSK